MESIINENLSSFFIKDWIFQFFFSHFLDMTWSILILLYSQELLRKNYSIWISNEYSNVYCLKSVKAIAFKIWLWVVNSYIFWSKQKKKIMSILGKDIPSQRKNRTLLKRRHRWLCLASVYQIIWNTLVKHGFINNKKTKKKKSEYFISIFGTWYSIGISLHVGAFKKDMQQNSSIELAFISR